MKNQTKPTLFDRILSYTPHILLSMVLITAFVAISFAPSGALKVQSLTLAEAEKKEQAFAKELSDLSKDLEGINADIAATVVTLDDIVNNKLPSAIAREKKASAEAIRTTKLAQGLRKRLNEATELLNQSKNALKVAVKGYEQARNSIGFLARNDLKSADNFLALQLMLDADNADEFIASLVTGDSLQRLETRLANKHANDSNIAENKASRSETITELVNSLKIQAEQKEAAAAAAEAEAAAAKAEMEDLELSLTVLKDRLQDQKATVQEKKKAAEKSHDDILKELGILRQGDGGDQYIDPNTKGKFNYPLTTRRITCTFYDCSAWFGGCVQHGAIDFGAACGTPIYATAAGEVKGAGTDWGAGGVIYVAINHGEFDGSAWASSYLHLSKLNVSAGQSVKRGELIGWVGNTGWSTGCHLHFEIIQNGYKIDPLKVL